MRKVVIAVLVAIFALPAQAAVTIYTDRQLFLQAATDAVQHDWVSQGEAVVVPSPISLGNASVHADQLVLYDDGGYGTTVYLAASGLPGQTGIVQVSSGDAFLGLDLGSLLGESTFFYTINGTIGTITIDDNGDTFLGAIDSTGAPVTAQFVEGPQDEFDILHVYTSDNDIGPPVSEIPEPAGWVTMIGGLLAVGAVLRHRRPRFIEA